jgi:hypothetical protein
MAVGASVGDSSVTIDLVAMKVVPEFEIVEVCIVP